MDKIHKENKVQITVTEGTDIALAIQEAIATSKSQGVTVSFDFNGQEVVVDQDSTFETAYKSWVDNCEQTKLPIRVKMSEHMVHKVIEQQKTNS